MSWLRGRSDRQLALLWLTAAASAVALRPLWLALVPLLRPCPFRALTGIPCPTCGTTRAALGFLDGHLVSAFAANPLSALAAVIFVAGAPLMVLLTMRRRPIPDPTLALPRWPRVAALVAVALNWSYLIFTE